MKMVFWGYNNYGEIVLHYFVKKGYTIPLIITPSSDCDKSKRIQEVAGNGVKVISITDFTISKIKREIESVNPDVMLSCSFKYKIPKECLLISNKKIINIHGAKLPEFRGANMLNWVIIEGCNKTGVTLHYMSENIDAGEIISYIEYPIYEYDDALTLKDRMYRKTIELLNKEWDNIINNIIKPKKQDHSKAKYYPARVPDDGLINWRANAKEIYNLTRALVSPFPGAFTFYDNSKLVIERCKVIVDNKVHFKPGKIIDVKSNYILVTCLYNMLEIKQIVDFKTKETVSFKIFEKNKFFTND